MKSNITLLIATLLAAALLTPAFAQQAPAKPKQDTQKNCMKHMPMKDMDSKSMQNMHMNCMDNMPKQHMPMEGMKGMKNMPMQDMQGTTQGAQVTAKGMGVVKAVDTARGTITIKHQAIAALHWPAMTMTFKAADAELLKKVKAGEKVSFGLHAKGMKGTVIWIKPVQP